MQSKLTIEHYSFSKPPNIVGDQYRTFFSLCQNFVQAVEGNELDKAQDLLGELEDYLVQNFNMRLRMEISVDRNDVIGPRRLEILNRATQMGIDCKARPVGPIQRASEPSMAA